MKRENGAGSLSRRIREGSVDRRDVTRRLAELAFGKVNDCVRLVLEEQPELERLDLSLLSEIRRSDKGGMEVKIVDRLRILEQLIQLTGEGGSEMDALLQALQSGEEA